MESSLHRQGVSLNGRQHHGREKRAARIRSPHDYLAMRLFPSTNGKVAEPLTLGVLGVTTGVGASTIAGHLAVSMSQLADHVLLIDADLEKNTTSTAFQLGKQSGLRQVFSDEFEVNECLHPTHVPTLQMLPAGGKSGRREIAMLMPRQLGDLLNHLKSQFAVIIVDLPSAADGSPGIHLSAVVDGVLLVVESERSEIEASKRITEQIASVRGNLLGVVLNKQRQHLPTWFHRQRT